MSFSRMICRWRSSGDSNPNSNPYPDLSRTFPARPVADQDPARRLASMPGLLPVPTHAQQGGRHRAGAVTESPPSAKPLHACKCSPRRPPSSQVPLLHALWQQSHARGYGSSRAGAPITAPYVPPTAPRVPARVPMGASEMRTLDIMQPANRNMNGYIFGGFLMRRALEVAWLSSGRAAACMQVLTTAPTLFTGRMALGTQALRPCGEVRWAR